MGFYIIQKRDLYKNIFLITLQYVVQGVTTGVFLTFAPLVLRKLYSPQDSAYYAFFVALPFSMKIFIAPITDLFAPLYFEKKLGWYCLAQVLQIPLLAFLYKIHFNLENNLIWFTSLSSLLIALVVLADISLDAYALQQFLDKTSLGSVCQFWGQTIGGLLTTYFFFSQNELSGALLFLPAFVSVSLFLFILLKENQSGKEIRSIRSLKEYKKRVQEILLNKNVQKLFVLLITCKLGTGFLGEATNFKLLAINFKESDLAKISLAVVLTNLAATYFSKKILQNDPLILWFRSIRALIVVSFLFGGTLFIAEKRNYSFIFMLLLFFIVLSHILLSLMFISMFGFMGQLCNGAIAGTYLTILASMLNLSQNVNEYLVTKLYLALNDNLALLAIGSSFYLLFWAGLSKKYVYELRNIPKSNN